MLLEIRDLAKSFRAPDGAAELVLDVPSFALERGAEVALAGASGSGKTTLLHLIAGLLVPDRGSIEVAGTDVTRLPEAARDTFRAEHIGYVFQDAHLLAGFSALENVELGMMFGRGIDRARALDLLGRLGLAERAQHKPQQLSVGQRQRVALARALANRPALLLADEPTGSLDRARAVDALALLRGVVREEGAALLIVSHDALVLEAFERVEDLALLNRAGRAAPHRGGQP